VQGRETREIGPELDWLSDDNRAGLSDGKGECTPAIRNRAADGHPERLRMAALEFRLAETLRGHGEAGMESEEGTAFEFLPRRKPCRNRADQPFLLST
jgi:hypothetical protein